MNAKHTYEDNTDEEIDNRIKGKLDKINADSNTK